MLSDAIMNSPIMAGEDGNPIGAGHMGGAGGFDFGMDPADDPELAMVYWMSYSLVQWTSRRLCEYPWRSNARDRMTKLVVSRRNHWRTCKRRVLATDAYVIYLSVSRPISSR